MRSKEFITEKRRRSKSKRARYGGYFYPGFGYSDNSASDSSGGDGGGGESKLNESLKSDVDNFAAWAVKRLHIKKPPKIELSMDTEEAQKGHHTGRHVQGTDSIWVYAKNRNLVDILRTVFHELVHIRQTELNMIKPGSSYPGSPIEAMADMLSGKYIKIYGKQHRDIFQ